MFFNSEGLKLVVDQVVTGGVMLSVASRERRLTTSMILLAFLASSFTLAFLGNPPAPPSDNFSKFRFPHARMGNANSFFSPTFSNISMC